jgi:hypothetical protein
MFIKDAANRVGTYARHAAPGAVKGMRTVSRLVGGQEVLTLIAVTAGALSLWQSHPSRSGEAKRVRRQW